MRLNDEFEGGLGNRLNLDYSQHMDNVDQAKGSSLPPKPAEIAKWETQARARLKENLTPLIKEIRKLEAADAVEANTRIIVNEILVLALGYDKFDNLTAEYLVKGDFADIGIRINKQLVAFVEIKRIKQDLKSAHLRQVESYALKEGVDWAILTNGNHWQVYHISVQPNQKSELTLVFEVNLLDEAQKPKEKQDLLFHISIEGISKGKLDALWKTREATSPSTITSALLSEAVLDAIKREVRKQKKQNLDIDQIRDAINDLLK